MLPAIFYSGILSAIYGFILSDSLIISYKDLGVSFLLGVPQLAFGFIFVTIGSRTTPAATVGLSAGYGIHPESSLDRTILGTEKDYEILFVHQKDKRKFNRGGMRNIGFIYVK